VDWEGQADDWEYRKNFNAVLRRFYDMRWWKVQGATNCGTAIELLGGNTAQQLNGTENIWNIEK
jgi:hypothetical protein